MNLVRKTGKNTSNLSFPMYNTINFFHYNFNFSRKFDLGFHPFCLRTLFDLGLFITTVEYDVSYV